jgi:hypothetical protein
MNASNRPEFSEAMVANEPEVFDHRDLQSLPGAAHLLSTGVSTGFDASDHLCDSDCIDCD